MIEEIVWVGLAEAPISFLYMCVELLVDSGIVNHKSPSAVNLSGRMQRYG